MKRNGVSLIETMIAVSASSLIFVLAIGILHQTMRLSSKTKGRTDFHQSNARFASRFRDDVHHATSAKLGDGGTLFLTLEDVGTITYRIASSNGSIVIRELKRSSGENTEQDVFRMLDSAQCEFKLKDNPDRVLLDVDSEIPGEPGSKRVEMRVSAVTNRWLSVAPNLGETP